MALPDVPDTYRLILRQAFQGQEVLNVFYYRDAAVGEPSPLSVAQGFWDFVKAAWRAWLPSATGTGFVQVDAERLEDDHPFATYLIPTGEFLGTRAAGGSQFMPPTLAGVIKLNVGTRVTRPGSKRIMGLLESDCDTLTLVTGTATLLQNLANVLDQQFTATGTLIEMTPVIVGYPTPTDLTVRVQDIVDAQSSTYVGHQISRDGRP